MKYALITGGSRGIGRAVCYKLAEMKYHILLNYINNDDEAQITKEQIMLKGVKCELIKFDVSDKEACEQILGTWIENNKESTIEVLVNNAGKRQDNLFVWMTDLQWKEVISTSLDSFFYVTRLVLNKMVHQRYGRIINMASLSGLKGNAGQTNYSAAKAGLIGATKALAQEVARRGVTVNVVAPGFIRTDMTQDLNEKQLSDIIPMRRFGTPEEVAEVVGFLASPGASYISGEVISVNGALYS
ncbi:MAG: 3-oxoacyl-ACP reductase FabG [Saprospiraceae bacterium]|uniref:3-oxoacyl-ACP reductase FabG n=1 Tax=Candidatus Defluviibacterium haderslevense TaxID=2981993 RepID=A0A9D7S6R9_9BACT|nr:3-oxoacyl-ACP reductase FabG [Candidatus Defluviibacterium haderslevense]MBK9716416.1 3-oxoacyl-ACP reductase FabG [Candidatus Defluviibacterium haderslevense]MBL0238761.1 3-oxoacyl-ACP reductase FabG [Candidatus Defluviibacterium haderslevense]